MVDERTDNTPETPEDKSDSPTKTATLNIGTIAFPHSLNVGRLGAIIPEGLDLPRMHAHQIDLIERRILRIEAALKSMGIPVDAFPL